MIQKCVLIFAALLHGAFCLAQDKKFTDDGNVWLVEEVFSHPNNIIHYNFYLNGDTLLQGGGYRKMYKGQFLVGAVREDSMGTVYYVDFEGMYYGAGPNQEFELFKFEGQAGDSIVFWRSSDNMKIRYDVVQTDSMVTFGKKRKTLFVVPAVPGYYSDTWVGEIGSLHMPLVLLQPVTEYAWQLKCFNLTNSEGAVCTSPATEESIPVSLNVSPNPVTGPLNVFLTSKGSSTIRGLRLFDGQGALVHQSRCDDITQSVSVNLGSLRGGVYFLEVGVGENSVWKKVVVQR